LADPADRLAAHGQAHLLEHRAGLGRAERAAFDEQLAALDLDLLDTLIEALVRRDAAPEGLEGIGPPAMDALEPGDREVGEAALEAGEVAVVLVAGGQGTRLGFDGPKGCYPIGPVSGRSLFQIHAEKVAAAGRRHGVDIPLYVMTGVHNHADTEAFFAAHAQFGLRRVRLFTQGQLPAVDRDTGAVLVEAPGRLALSPDGHGGTFRALAASGCLADMAAGGARTIFYLQVDNPLVAVCDPGFVGVHRRTGAEMSSKVVRKERPEERVGVVVSQAGRTRVVEYSDLPREAAERRAADGGLALRAGSIAVHVIEVEFAERLASAGGGLPYHRALKAVAHVEPDGRRVEPGGPNAVKFEQFLFDALPLARRTATVETDRWAEFAPLKNATGPDSAETVRRALSDLYASWLERAGMPVPRGPDGSAAVAVEISPLRALDAADLRPGSLAGLDVTRPVLLS
jgi:UDP-N-acetylglucosamine/UDP-N-acetylgalactosamine diphosphorylase